MQKEKEEAFSMEALTHRDVQTNGIALHRASAGKGPLVILLHGFPKCGTRGAINFPLWLPQASTRSPPICEATAKRMPRKPSKAIAC